MLFFQVVAGSNPDCIVEMSKTKLDRGHVSGWEGK